MFLEFSNNFWFDHDELSINLAVCCCCKLFSVKFACGEKRKWFMLVDEFDVVVRSFCTFLFGSTTVKHNEVDAIKNETWGKGLSIPVRTCTNHSTPIINIPIKKLENAMAMTNFVLTPSTYNVAAA